MRRLYIDLDGVLADFDGHYERLFGTRPDRLSPSAMSKTDFDRGFWDNIRSHPTFYQDLPPMPDAMQLWEGVKRLHPLPTILTGLPYSITEAEYQKRMWVMNNISASVPVIACASRDKRNYCTPGDVLVDDWIKWQSAWEDAGGIFIVHTSAEDSLAKLREIFQ